MPLVEITPAEIPAIREVMRDIQADTASFYAETARSSDLGGRVRAFLNSAQALNDLLWNKIADAAEYQDLFATRAAGVEVIEGVKYARNVTQHVLHIVKPGEDNVMVGGLHGLRTYEVWDEIPVDVHNELRPSTKALKGSYDSSLRDKDVTTTMLDVLGFYAGVNPDMVAKDEWGEWHGFPLMSQPGMRNPLHPEEPADLTVAESWINVRRPNGEVRVVCAQVTFDKIPYQCGFTFIGRHTFSPFAETVDQILFDVAAGMTYLVSDGAANIEDVTTQFPQASQGAVHLSQGDVSTWASPEATHEREEDWSAWADLGVWLRVARLEHSQSYSPAIRYEVRRARRLNAFLPTGR